ncbi:MAG: PIN domain-containing protein [Ignavibacteriae bacterium]|nr:PIN domain-containing protein [Ignavibacteriota bacterium]
MSHKFVADTVAIVLRLERRKLPAKVKQIFDETEQENSDIIIPAMVLAEIGYLSERRKIEISLTDVLQYSENHKTVSIFPVDKPTIEQTFLISDIPELHDRIIAGAAKALNLPILTNDSIITQSKFVTTIWK